MTLLSNQMTLQLGKSLRLLADAVLDHTSEHRQDIPWGCRCAQSVKGINSQLSIHLSRRTGRDKREGSSRDVRL